MKKSWLPLAIVALLALWPISLLLRGGKSDPSDRFAAQSFGRLPVLTSGRIQPLDSLARNSLLQLREKQTAQTAPWSADSKTLSAVEWLMEMSMNPAIADTRPVFRIDNPDMKGLLGLSLDPDQANGSDGKHYTWKQVKPKLEELQNESRRVGKMDASERKPYDQAVLRLFNGCVIYLRLQNTLEPQDAMKWEQEWLSFREHLTAGVSALRAQQAGKETDSKAAEVTMADLARFSTMQKLETPSVVPPANPTVQRDGWISMGEALLNSAQTETPAPAIGAYARMASAYREGRVVDFNIALGEYRSLLAVNFAPELSKAAREQRFNALQPFYIAMSLYVLAGLFALAYWFNPRAWDWVRVTASHIVVLAWVIHTIGLLYRMTLEGRPPVTNLYSSAVFIGWGACVLGWVLERFWKNSIGLVVSSTIGFLTLIIAHHLSLSGDTMEMMRAVLDTNFWLATHVVVVTLGYASTFVAGFLAIIYIVMGTFTPALTKELGAALGKMVYGIVCFATLFSFVGTVLGGIWADQSWGRFWGWDPKENGALLIVIWNAIILHARWGGLVRERGLMCLAVGGNIITAWSWFGVNMLGIGLHSYGFTDAAFRWLVIFGASQIVLILLGAWACRVNASEGGRAA